MDMDKLVWFAFGVAPPVVVIALLGLFYWLLWYVLVYLPAPVPTDELAGLSVETKELLGGIDVGMPISRGDLAKARRKLQQTSLLNVQRQALSEVDCVN